jgi:hypothetical protein
MPLVAKSAKAERIAAEESVEATVAAQHAQKLSAALNRICGALQIRHQPVSPKHSTPHEMFAGSHLGNAK